MCTMLSVSLFATTVCQCVHPEKPNYNHFVDLLHVLKEKNILNLAYAFRHNNQNKEERSFQ